MGDILDGAGQRLLQNITGNAVHSGLLGVWQQRETVGTADLRGFVNRLHNAFDAVCAAGVRTVQERHTLQ